MSSVINGLLEQVADVMEAAAPRQDAQRAFHRSTDVTKTPAHRAFDVRLAYARPVEGQLWSAAGRYLQRIGFQVRVTYRHSGTCLSTSIITAEDAVTMQQALLAAQYSGATMRGKPAWLGYTVDWNPDWVVVTARFELIYQEEIT